MVMWHCSKLMMRLSVLQGSCHTASRWQMSCSVPVLYIAWLLCWLLHLHCCVNLSVKGWFQTVMESFLTDSKKKYINKPVYYNLIISNLFINCYVLRFNYSNTQKKKMDKYWKLCEYFEFCNISVNRIHSWVPWRN